MRESVGGEECYCDTTERSRGQLKDLTALYNCTARAFARAASRVMDLTVASPSFFSAAFRSHSNQPVIDDAALRSVCFARASGSEVELPIVDYYGAAGDGVNVGQVVDNAAGGGGHSFRFCSNLQNLE